MRDYIVLCLYISFLFLLNEMEVIADNTCWPNLQFLDRNTMSILLSSRVNHPSTVVCLVGWLALPLECHFFGYDDHTCGFFCLWQIWLWNVNNQTMIFILEEKKIIFYISIGQKTRWKDIGGFSGGGNIEMTWTMKWDVSRDDDGRRPLHHLHLTDWGNYSFSICHWSNPPVICISVWENKADVC